jgi:hypothetical protein
MVETKMLGGPYSMEAQLLIDFCHKLEDTWDKERHSVKGRLKGALVVGTDADLKAAIQDLRKLMEISIGTEAELLGKSRPMRQEMAPQRDSVLGVAEAA